MYYSILCVIHFFMPKSSFVLSLSLYCTWASVCLCGCVGVCKWLAYLHILHVFKRTKWKKKQLYFYLMHLVVKFLPFERRFKWKKITIFKSFCILPIHVYYSKMAFSLYYNTFHGNAKCICDTKYCRKCCVCHDVINLFSYRRLPYYVIIQKKRECVVYLPFVFLFVCMRRK